MWPTVELVQGWLWNFFLDIMLPIGQKIVVSDGRLKDQVAASKDGLWLFQPCRVGGGKQPPTYDASGKTVPVC